MRQVIVAGNWKMNKTVSESVEFVKELQEGLGFDLKLQVLVFPPFTSLYSIGRIVDKSRIGFGAQNMYFEKAGAFTGEISADMIKSCGGEYVIVGHSERRHIFGESDEVIGRKVKSALESGLKPVVCIGEKLDEREAGKTEQVIERQFYKAFEYVQEDMIEDCVIAYEPVWAIGTGVNATPEQACEAHDFVRGLLEKKYNGGVAENFTILYGGSVKPGNCKELFEKNGVDGFLVGGASLKVDSFLEIIKIVNNMLV